MHVVIEAIHDELASLSAVVHLVYRLNLLVIQIENMRNHRDVE